MMDGLDALGIFIFLASTFVASLITGLAGFAFGIIAAGPWLHVLKPAQVTTLIVAFGLLVQSYSVWKLRAAIRLQRLLPFLIGSAFGVPLGVELLRWIAPAHLRAGTGIVLIVYSVYGLLRPRLPDLKSAGRAADGAGWFFRRGTRRRDWPCGDPGDDLVRPARLAEGRAAGRFSAGGRRNFRHNRHMARRRWNSGAGHPDRLRDRAPRRARRHLGRR